MSTTATEGLLDTDLQELTRSLTGKNKAEQLALIRQAAEEKLGASFEQPVVQLTDEQLRMALTGEADLAKKIASEVAGEYERKYNLNPSAARDLGGSTVYSAIEKEQRKHEDLKMAAEVLRAMTHVSRGTAPHSTFQSALDKEQEYIRQNWQGHQTRAMSVTTDTTGGYLGGEIFSTMLYDNVARVSQARKYCTIVNLEREILRIPKLTSTFTAEQSTEAATMTASQWVLAQFTLQLKKLDVLSKPFSIELLEVADPALVQAIIQFATIELAKKEDALVFGTSGNGILGQTAKVVQDTAGTGTIAITDVTFDHMADMINAIDEQYIPDDDIKGSGLIGGEARFWVPRAVINTLSKSKGNDNYHWANVQELKMNKNVHGFEMKRVVSMSQAPNPNTAAFCFGNLGYHWCGVRPGYRIELMSQGTVDSVNLNETGSYALRVIEFFDSDSIDDNAISVYKTCAS